MANSDGRTKAGLPLRIAIAVLVLLLVIAIAYTGLWFFLANQLRQRVESTTAHLEAEGIVADCGNLAIGGYPFRLAVDCDEINAETGYGAGASLSTASFRSGASVTNPGHVVSSLDGPVSLAFPDGRQVEAEWRDMGTVTHFNLSGLDNALMRAIDFTADISTGGGPGAQISSDMMELTARRRGEDLDLRGHARGVAFSGKGLPGELPALDLGYAVAVHDSADYLNRPELSPKALRGRAGRITDLRLVLPEGPAIVVTGPFEISDGGLISGSFEVAVESLERWRETLVLLFPDYRGPIEGAASALSNLAEDGSLTANIEVRQGYVTLGIFPIGRLPPI